MTTVATDRLKKVFGLSLGYLVLIVVAVLVTVPAAWMFISSFKVDSELMLWPIKILPTEWHFENYLYVFTLPPFLQIALRTAALAFVCSALGALTSAMGGYGFARYLDVRGNKALFRIVLILLVVPGVVMSIPQFILYSVLGLTNTYWPWILPALTGGAYSIFLFRQFFLTVPKELEEAAAMDGCGVFRFFWQILLPNSKPVLATVMIFSFQAIWGDYFGPMIYLTYKNTLLGYVMATAFVDERGIALRTPSLAATMYYMLPLVVFFFIGQKYILKGFITSGLKG